MTYERQAMVGLLRSPGMVFYQFGLDEGALLRTVAAQIEADGKRVEALEAENERLRFHLDTALEALIMEGVCDGECGACKAARAALGEKQ